MSIFSTHIAKSDINTPVVTGVSLEALQTEMETIDAERQVLNTEISFFGGQTASLEGIAERLEVSLDVGGLNTQAAEFMQEHADSITKSMGLEQSVVASMESFGPASDREEATRASMEGIKQMAKDAWTAIIEMIKKAILKVKAFFKAAFDAGAKLEKRAKALAERAKDLSGSPTEKNIKLGSNTKVLATTGGKVVVPADIVSTAKSYENYQETKMRMLSIDSSGDLKVLAEELSAGEISNVDKIGKLAKAAYGVYTKPLKSTDPRYTQANVGIIESPIGNVAMITTMGGASGDEVKPYLDAIAKLTVRMDLAKKDFKHPDNDVESKVLEVSQIQEIADSLATFGSNFAKDRSEHEKDMQFQDKIVRNLEKVKAGVGKLSDDDKKHKPLANAYAAAVSATARYNTDSISLVAKDVLRNAIAMLAYAEASAAQYKKA